MTVFAPASPSERAKLRKLLDRYRDLLAGATDEMLQRGILSQIQSLESKLREYEEDALEPALLPRAAAIRKPARLCD